MERISQTIKLLAKKFLELPSISKWLGRHPKTNSQLTERLSLRQFTGLPLTIFVIVFLFIIYLLLTVIQDYLASDPLVLADIRITNLFYIFRTTTLLHFSYFITLFAESTVIIPLAIILSILLWKYHQRIYLFTLWFALIVGESLTFFGKHVFQRERPDIFLRAITEDSFSFPSGHATTVVLFYGLLTYIFIRGSKSLKIRTAALSFLVVFIILVDFSRIYLGVHYLSDVIAGNLVGLATLILAIGITEWFISNKSNLVPNPIKRSEILFISIITIVFTSVLYFFSISPASKNVPITVQKINIENVSFLFDRNGFAQRLVFHHMDTKNKDLAFVLM